MHNLSSITACLPIPISAGKPWEIIPIDLSMVIQYDNLSNAIAKANITHYLDEKERCRWKGDGILEDPIAWRPGDNRTIFWKKGGKEHPTASHSLNQHFLDFALAASGGHAARLLDLCVTKNHTQNVSDLPECQTLRSKPHTWTKPLERLLKFLGKVKWCLDWGITLYTT